MNRDLHRADTDHPDSPATSPNTDRDAQTLSGPTVPVSGRRERMPPATFVGAPRSSRHIPTPRGSSDGSSGPPSGGFAAPVEDRYEILEVLGAGGMGRVYKAWDHTLARHVALKLLHDNEPGLIERFLKEAQAQARVKHDNVCKIFEAGAINGEPYIAMQLIEGPTLKRMRDALTLDEKLEIMAKIAEGLHAAHRIGLIHRDVKPSNMMLERKEDGQWHPYLMDFGLAREVSGVNGQTQTESAVGTPSYMALEQIKGEAKKLDARTDVYGLGATLYELLTGRPPFVGETQLEVLLKAANEDPTPLRDLNPSIPPDLQTIVLQCLEKEPARRYQSARALSEDLLRCRKRTGPIVAKPASLAYLLYKKARRNWPIVLVSSVLLVSGLLTVGLWVRASILSQRREALAEELGKTVIKIELFLRYASALPVHDMAAERDVIQEQMRFLEKTLATGGSNSAGPAHYALGRGHLALKSHAEAKTNLELAIADGYARPEVHYALGLALGKLYEQELDKAQRIADKKLRDEKKQEAERSYRDPSLVHLRQSEGTQVESKAYIEALVALYEKRYEEALVKAEEAMKVAPWLYEAKKVEGDARFALGMAAKDQGQTNDARGAFARSIAAYKIAADMARSDGMIQEALAETWIQLLEFDVNVSKLNMEAYEAALAACEQALKANPESANAYTKRGRAHSHVGVYQLAHGEDLRPTLEKAIESGKAALRFAPDDGITWDMLGNSYRKLAQSAHSAGEDPSPLLNEATKSLDEAIKHQPTLAWAWNDAGNVWLFRAQTDAERGIDPRESIEHGTKLYGQAAMLDPAYLWPHTGIALLMTESARYALMFGKDPTAHAQQGIESSNRAIQMQPAFGVGYFRRASLLAYIARYEFLSGRDPKQTITRIEDDLRTALTDLSDWPYVYATQGEVYHLRASHEIRAGIDAMGTLERGRAALRRGIELDPTEVILRAELARLEITAARHAATKGDDPTPFVASARAALLPATNKKVPNAEVLVAQAELHTVRAEYARRLRVDIDEEIQKGLHAADAALQAVADMPLALAAKGTLELLRARSKEGNQRKAAAAIALSTLSRALGRNPLLPERVRLLRDEAKSLSEGNPARLR